MKNNNLSEMAKAMGRIGGKKSVRSRFAGKTKEQISNMMRNVRKGDGLYQEISMTPKQKEKFEEGLDGVVDNLNKNTN